MKCSHRPDATGSACALPHPPPNAPPKALPEAPPQVPQDGADTARPPAIPRVEVPPPSFASSPLPLFEGLAGTLQLYLHEVEAGGYAPFFDTLRRAAAEITSGQVGSRPRAYELRSAAHLIAAAALDAVSSGAVHPDGSNLLDAVRSRLGDPTFNLEEAARRLDAHPDWQERPGISVLEDGRFEPLTGDRAWSWSEMGVENALWPREHALELLNTQRLSRLVTLVGGGASPSDRAVLRAEALMAPSDLDSAPAGGLYALAQAFFVPVAELDASALEAEIRRRVDAGFVPLRSEAAQVALHGLLSEPAGAWAERAEATGGWQAHARHLADSLTKTAAAGLVSYGAGAAVGMAFGGATRLATAARFVTTSGTFSTVLAASDGDFSSRRYARDMTLFAVLGGFSRVMATRLAHLPPTVRFGASSSLAAVVLTAGEVAAQLGRSSDVGLKEVGQRFLEHLAHVVVLHGMHVRLARLEARIGEALARPSQPAPGQRSAQEPAAGESARTATETDRRSLEDTLGGIESALKAAGDRTEALVEAVARADAPRAAQLEAEIGQALDRAEALEASAVELAERLAPGEGASLAAFAQAQRSAWNFAVTPGRRPQIEVAEAWRSAEAGSLGTPVAQREGIQVRDVSAIKHSSDTRGLWSKSMERHIEALVGELRGGQLTSFEEALGRMSGIAADAARVARRNDGRWAAFGEDRRTLPDEVATWTPLGGHPPYAEPAGWVISREGQFSRAPNPAGPVPRLSSAMGWLHPNPVELARALPALESVYQRARSASSRSELVEAVAELQWRAYNLMPFSRGSASAVDALGRGLLLAGGDGGASVVQPGRWRIGVAPDLEAFLRPLDRYVADYPSLYDPLPSAEPQPKVAVGY